MAKWVWWGWWGGGFIKGLGVGILLASVSLSEADPPYLWAPPIKLPSDKNSAELRTWPTLLAVHSGKASRVERRQRRGRESGWLVLRGCRCVLKCCAHTHTHTVSPLCNLTTLHLPINTHAQPGIKNLTEAGRHNWAGLRYPASTLAKLSVANGRGRRGGGGKFGKVKTFPRPDDIVRPHWAG